MKRRINSTAERRVVFETLNKAGMLKNKKLAKHISDAAWGALHAKVSYKADRSGKHVVFISQWYPSSKTCSECGLVLDELPLSVRQWECECGAVHDRDINAAINIKLAGIQQLKAEGLSVSARGGRRKTGMLPAGSSLRNEKLRRQRRRAVTLTERLISSLEENSEIERAW